MSERRGFVAQAKHGHSQLVAHQKAPRGVSLYSLRVNRPLGRWAAACAVALGMTPNQVTLVGALCSGGGIALIGSGEATVIRGLVAGALLALGFVLDSADGQVARLQGTGSRSGEWLDHMIDAAVKMSMHIAVAAAWYRSGRPGGQLLIPLLFLVVSLLLFLAVTLGGLLRLLEGVTPESRPSVEHSMRRAVLLLPVDYGVLCWVFLTWGFDSVFFVCYTLLLISNALFLAAYFRYWLKELS